MGITRPFGRAANASARVGWYSILAITVLLAGCGSGTGSGNGGNNISVAITNKVTTLQAGTAAISFSATVQNDSSNSGVTWNLTANGTACSPTCGTLSLATSSTVSYVPPASGPSAPNSQPTLIATSVAKTNKSDADTFTITAALTVSITNKFVSVNTGASPFVVDATVQNDSTNSGVSWALTGATCATTPCGTLSGATTTNVTYESPTSVPSSQLTLTATSVHDPSKTDSFTFTVRTAAITVTIQGKFNSVIAGSSNIFLEANIVNDTSRNPAVTWTLTAGNTNCQPTCGTVTPVGSAGVQYSPPTSVPTAPAGYNTPTLTATSNADATKSDSDTFTITAAPPISVTITKLQSILATGNGVEFSAYVQNDFSNSGVTWTLTCTPPATSCGTLTPSTSTTTATYVPSGPAPAQATVTATSQANSAKSDSSVINLTSSVTNACGSAGGAESLLNGHYALLLEGFWSGAGGVPNLIAASFQADGTGGITAGEEDVNDSISPQHLTFTSTGSLYTVGSDHRGCLQLTNSGGTTSVFHFALAGINSGVASKGRVIEFDDNSGNGQGSRGSGILRQQDPNSFVLTALQSQYAFGVDGWTQSDQFSRLAGAGSFTNSNGTFSNGVDDLVFSGGITSPDTTGLSGNINVVSPTTGRTTGNFDIFKWAIYIVNSAQFFVIGTDPVSNGTVSVGRVIGTGPSFTASSLSGNYVVHATGNGNSSADVNLELLTMTPGGAQAGTLGGTVYSYGVGNGAQTTMLSGVTYNVDAGSGRTVLGNPGDNLPVLYVTTPTDGIAAFVVGVGTDALFGMAEPQTGATLSAGTYIFGTEDPSDNTVPNKAGVETITSGGAFSSTFDQSTTSALPQGGQTVNGTVSLGPAGTGNIGPSTVAITSGSKLFSIDESGGTSGPAAIVVAEQ